MLVVSEVRPEVALKTSLLASQHGDMRVVGPHHGGLENPLALEFIQRTEEIRDGLHPVAQGAPRQVDPVPRENVFQSIQRQMIAEFTDEHLRDQTRPGNAAWNRSRRQRSCRDTILTTRASVLGTDVNVSFELGRLVLQFPRDVLADALHRPPTARARLVFLLEVVVVANLRQLVPVDLALLAAAMGFHFVAGFWIWRGGHWRLAQERRVQLEQVSLSCTCGETLSSSAKSPASVPGQFVECGGVRLL